MKIKTVFFLMVLLVSNTIIGQALNEYKYVIIPSKYDFQKSENQYELNALTKFLFEKEGLKVIYGNLEMPADIANNPCDALRADVNNESNMFTTKLVIELINCKNQKIFTSQEGRSKEKEYKKGYQEALREAFESVTEQNYTYTGVKKSINLKKTPPIIEVVEDLEEPIEVEFLAAEEVEKVEEKKLETGEISVGEGNSGDRDVNATILDVPSDKKLYAQENRLGYQLVDSSPKVVFILLKSGTKDVYFLKNQSGNFFKENNKWYAEYYFDGKLVKQEFEVKW